MSRRSLTSAPYTERSRSFVNCLVVALGCARGEASLYLALGSSSAPSFPPRPLPPVLLPTSRPVPSWARFGSAPEFLPGPSPGPRSARGLALPRPASWNLGAPWPSPGSDVEHRESLGPPRPEVPQSDGREHSPCSRVSLAPFACAPRSRQSEASPCILQHVGWPADSSPRVTVSSSRRKFAGPSATFPRSAVRQPGKTLAAPSLPPGTDSSRHATTTDSARSTSSLRACGSARISYSGPRDHGSAGADQCGA